MAMVKSVNSSDKNSLLKAFESYIQFYFRERDPEKTFKMLSINYTGFGTGVDEIGRDPESFRELYLRDFAQAPGRVDVEFDFIDSEVVEDKAGIVFSVLSLKTEIEGQPVHISGLRLTVVFSKESGEWLLLHMHISFPAEIHSEGESYPLKELEERNRILEQMVKDKTSELEQRNKKLEEALQSVKQLSGLLPICASCKKIRDDEGYWHQIEEYLRVHSEAEFSHGICPDCRGKLMDDLSLLKSKIVK